ncbi:PTS sugar transporter subunit IIC [Trichloromonas sp.]|uniref:PTS sugar transporter subunit IIC n=1 Tax=Trichloromonas sp. TaxID=3069249 RepID=UPI002A3F336E|nr:PTS sugar transporter subunit IIC [Trichloromonas sp.]
MAFSPDYLYAGLISLLVGLDRTAVLQLLICRPIVAAPLTGWVLGDSQLGLQAGILLELLWLGRLPVGAAIPPDDTQIAVGGTALALVMGAGGVEDLPLLLLSLLVALPLGKCGQFFDHLARLGNGRLLVWAEKDLHLGRPLAATRWHLLGLVFFALASLGTYLGIVLPGSLLLPWLAPYLLPQVGESAPWLFLAFPLVGTAVFLGTLRSRRILALYLLAFFAVYLLREGF